MVYVLRIWPIEVSLAFGNSTFLSILMACSAAATKATLKGGQMAQPWLCPATSLLFLFLRYPHESFLFSLFSIPNGEIIFLPWAASKFYRAKLEQKLQFLPKLTLSNVKTASFYESDCKMKGMVVTEYYDMNAYRFEIPSITQNTLLTASKTKLHARWQRSSPCCSERVKEFQCWQ